MKKVILGMLLFIALGAKAQNEEGQNKSYKTTVVVKGNCEMCKARIEKSVLKTKGVKYASWNTETKKLSLIYNQKKTSLKEIQKSVLNVGHDVDTLKASDAAYEKLHFCCKYR